MILSSDELPALADTIREHEAARGQPISRLGYFCAPFRPEGGAFADRVIKVYRGLEDAGELRRLEAAHGAYLAVLERCGVPVPETGFALLDLGTGSVKVPVVVQRALPADSMMRTLMCSCTLPEALAHMEAAGQVIARFWQRVEGETGRIGFHPSIRNFAIVEGEAVFFDSFPPLIDYSREEMGRLLLRFSANPLMRFVGPFLRARVTGIQDEWYSPAETLIGLVGSACRLRPQESAHFLEWGREFAGREMVWVRDEIEAGLASPPRLPGYWTSMRRLLGLQGRPNV